MRVLVIIPSRFHSTRLPQKPLALIRGVSLVERVYRQCEQAGGIDDICVATDHDAIRDEVIRFGGKVVMTPAECPSGTDRVADAAKRLGAHSDDIILNVQGDEPLMPPSVIGALADAMRRDASLELATPVTPLTDPADLTNSNVVKVAQATSGDALYFSRQTIPYLRDLGGTPDASWLTSYPYKKHIGLYAYRMKVLDAFAALDESSLERAERLEQLRFLEAGFRMRCVEVPAFEAVAVDTADDVLRVEAMLAAREAASLV